MKRTSQEVEAKIVQLYQDGLNTMRVAEETNTTHATVYHVLKRHGVPMRSSNMPVTPETIETIRQMSEQGIGFKIIAKTLKTGYPTLRRLMRENGIVSRYGQGEKHQSWKGGKQINSKGYAF